MISETFCKFRAIVFLVIITATPLTSFGQINKASDYWKLVFDYLGGIKSEVQLKNEISGREFDFLSRMMTELPKADLGGSDLEKIINLIFRLQPSGRALLLDDLSRKQHFVWPTITIFNKNGVLIPEQTLFHVIHSPGVPSEYKEDAVRALALHNRIAPLFAVLNNHILDGFYVRTEALILIMAMNPVAGKSTSAQFREDPSREVRAQARYYLGENTTDLIVTPKSEILSEVAKLDESPIFIPGYLDKYGTLNIAPTSHYARISQFYYWHNGKQKSTWQARQLKNDVRCLSRGIRPVLAAPAVKIKNMSVKSIETGQVTDRTDLPIYDKKTLTALLENIDMANNGRFVGKKLEISYSVAEVEKNTRLFFIRICSDNLKGHFFSEMDNGKIRAAGNIFVEDIPQAGASALSDSCIDSLGEIKSLLRVDPVSTENRVPRYVFALFRRQEKDLSISSYYIENDSLRESKSIGRKICR